MWDAKNSSTNLSEDFHRFNRDMVAGVFNQVTNEQGFDHTCWI